MQALENVTAGQEQEAESDKIRCLFLAAAACFLFPMIVWLKIAGAVLLALAWGAMPLYLRAKAR